MPSPVTFFTARRGTVGLIILIGLALSLLIWHYAGQREQERIHTEFLRRAQAQASLAHERLLIYEEMVYGLRSAFIGQNDVNRKEFAHVAREILSRHSGVQALAWVSIVKDNDREAVEKRASRELKFPFVFKRRLPTGELVTSPQAEEYSVITYIEPLIGNQSALGYDLTSAPTAAEVAASRKDKTLKVSHPIRLAQATSPNDEAGVVFMLPVFDPSTEDSPVQGFVEGVFRAEMMLSQAHHIGSNEGLRSFYLDRETGSPTPVLLYANLAGQEPLRSGSKVALPADENQAAFRGDIVVGDRRWSLVIEMDPAWAHGQRTSQPLLMLIAGIAITVLLALFINSLLQRTGRVEHEVAIRTAELHESDSRLQSILDHSPALIFVKDLAGAYVLFNQQFQRFCARPFAEIKGRTDHDLFSPAQADAFRANDQRVLDAGQPMEFEETAATDRGNIVSIVQKFPLLDADGRPYALCGIATNITDRKQSELELQEKRRQLSNLISQLPGAAFRCLFDENFTMLFASEGMLQLTGFSADEFTSGRIHLASLTVIDDRPAVRNAVAGALRERRNFEVEYRLIHRDGREKWALVRGRPFYDETGVMRFIEGLAIDVTALKQAEAEKIAFERNLLETQKLESLGVLAGGIAHDFNNLLTAILGNASLMRYATPRTDSADVHLKQIENAARRAADLCTQMLAYTGKGKISSGRLDVSQLVRETTSLLEVSIAKNCALVFHLADNLPPVLGDTTQLRQIVMNLVINASDAIGERSDGKITLTTFSREVDPALFRSAIRQPKLAGGRYVGLEVSDNGCGMSAGTIARIFEPFFTTKFSGRGLGLSAVLGIVQTHQGALFLESEPDRGSTFRLFLPAATGVAVATPGIVATAPAETLRGTILVADDDDAVRTIIGKVLRKHGASVLLAADGAEALELYGKQRDRIDLILLDLTMPGLSGEEILLRLQQLKASQKIVIMSGYGEEETMRRFAELGVVGFISKPFEVHAVVAKLQSLLA